MLANLPFGKVPTVAAAVVFGCIALGGVSLSASAENVERSEPASVLVQALDHVGDRVIKTGEFRYSLSVVTQPPTKEMIAERVEAIRQHLLITIEKFAGNEKAQRSLQRSLETIEEETARHMMESVSTTTNLFFVLGGPKLGSDRYVEYSTVDRESGRSGPASVVLQRSLGPSDGLVIYLEGAVGDAVANRRLMSPAGQEPQHLGRLTGALAETASLPSFNLQDSVSDVEVSVPEGEQDSDLRQISCQLNRVVGFDARKFGVVAVRFHVDPSRGFVTPLVQELDIADKVVREWISSDYFQPRGTKLWFPKVCVYREGPAEAPMRTERYEFSPDGVVLNVDIPAERFAVTLNPGRVIADARDSDGSNANFIAQREVQISLDDLGRLSEMEAFNHFVAKTVPNPASPLGYWLIAANVLVVCFLLVWVIRRRRSQLAAALILALVATL